MSNLIKDRIQRLEINLSELKKLNDQISFEDLREISKVLAPDHPFFSVDKTD
jgi:hypothetical protein